MKIKPLKICLRETKWRFLADNKVNEKVILPFSIPLVSIYTYLRPATLCIAVKFVFYTYTINRRVLLHFNLSIHFKKKKKIFLG